MWSREWPTEPGFYWFYGYQGHFDQKQGKRRLSFAEVRRISNGVCYISNGTFMYRNDGYEGVWQPIEAPALPED